MRHAGKFAVAGLALAAALPALAFPPAPAEGTKDQKIVFTSLDSQNKKIGVGIMNADGTKRTLLSAENPDKGELDPALSPDGKHIVFIAASVKDKKIEVWVMKADGSDRKKLTDIPEQTFAMTPAWSPDGKRIAYAQMKMDGDGPPPDADLMVMDADGKNGKSLGKGSLPAFSPDGKKILYTVNKKTDDFDPRLHVMDADGKNGKELVKSHSMMGAWSPDGKHIAYLGAESEGGKVKPHVYTCKADGSDPTALTKGDEGEIGVLWSADGKRLFVNRVKLDGGRPKSAAIWVMDADGKNEKQVSKDEGMDLLSASSFFLPRSAPRKP
ncbi:MAG TPA: hypothetical protein VKA46_14715 [Gemmataceae bacterium]|nr:hypothetical protein [Gemmataceae bacterium]